MNELQKLIQDALSEKWPAIKELDHRFLDKPEAEGEELILSFSPPRSVAFAVKDSDRVKVELFQAESEDELRRESVVHNVALHRIAVNTFWVKNIVNSHGKYYIEHQTSEGEGVVDYWSLSEFCDQIESAFVNHEGGISSSG